MRTVSVQFYPTMYAEIMEGGGGSNCCLDSFWIIIITVEKFYVSKQNHVIHKCLKIHVQLIPSLV